MGTKFASPERSGSEELKTAYSHIKSIDYIQELINSLPFVMAILNENRQIIFCNSTTLDATGNYTVEQILGKRPGEALNCINSCSEESGCGTAEQCRVCGAVSSIIKAQRQNKRIVEECRITLKTQNGQNVSLDFRVSSTPLIWDGRNYIVFSAIDISHEKRRNVLEHIFFHDILNTAGSLNGFIDLLKSTDNIEMIRGYLASVELISNEMTEELLSQRTLMEAENNDLVIRPEKVNTIDLLNLNSNKFSVHPEQLHKTIRLDKSSVSVDIQTDPMIMNRILTNMLKNALEASAPGDAVTAGCAKSGDDVIFRVQNQGVMPESMQLQIFQRSFSTKGTGRGIGTYSMRLLGEKYLGGKVYFESNEEKGTVFYFRLPVGII